VLGEQEKEFHTADRDGGTLLIGATAWSRFIAAVK
jgi:hypothetical protein